MYNIISPPIWKSVYHMIYFSFWKLYNKIKLYLQCVWNSDNDNYVVYVHKELGWQLLIFITPF